MRVCILGAGGQGAGLAGLLAQQEGIESITLADQSSRMARSAVDRVQTLGNRVKVRGIKAEQVDAGNREEVARVARGADLVFNATVPSCNIPIMRACLDVGAHYMDLLSLPFQLPGVAEDETVDAQLKLDGEFDAAGLCAIPNVGAAPGWTDLAAKYIVDELDTVEQVIIRFAGRMESSELIASFAPAVWFSEWFGPPHPLCTVNGEPREVNLLESEEEYVFPEPVGSVTIYTVTVHPEIVTIPKFVGKPVGRVEEKGGLRIGKMKQKDIWIEAIRRQTSKHKGTDNMMALFASSFISPSDFKEAYDKGIVTDGAVCMSVEGTGAKNGGYVRHTVYDVITLAEAMKHLPWASQAPYMTMGVPLELILMLRNGEIGRRGVLGVATLGDPKSIFERLVDKGHQMSEKIERAMQF